MELFRETYDNIVTEDKVRISGRKQMSETLLAVNGCAQTYCNIVHVSQAP